MGLIKQKFFLNLLLLITIFLFDRLTKNYILGIAEISLVDIEINSFINLILVWNSGIGFGLFSSSNQLLYNAITILIILVNFLIIYFVFKAEDFKAYFFVMILGGSLGNLYDRIIYSAVPDFIDIHINDFHWFVFNMADIFITLGVICLIFAEIFFNKRKIINEHSQ